VSLETSDTTGSQRRLGFWVGLALFAIILALPSPEGLSAQAQRAAAVAGLMAVWWITETVDIAVTAFLPIPLFPLLGVQSAREVAGYYADHIVFLYLGGFLIALAMERWNLHRRVALNVIKRVGSRPSRLVLGFIIATTFLSMWISNTATTMMMLPIATAVVNQLADLAVIDGESGPAVTERARVSFGVILLLAVAYSASVGGIGTIIGSPTNVAFLGFVSETFPQYPAITFVEWSLVCVPIVVLFTPLMWLYLCRFAADIPLSRIHFGGDVDVIESERRKLGGMRFEERAVLAISVLTAVLWILRSPFEVGGFTLPGWSSLFENPGSVQDSTVAVAMAVALFVLPAKALDSNGNPQRLMDWGTAVRGVPWGIVFLFGGGFALAGAIADTGLATWIGSQMTILKGAPIWILIPLSCLLSALLTETTSNIATVLMLSPVIAATAVEIGVHPYLLLFPAAIMASFAFMLPVATPPNAIVFSSGWISIRRMFRAGLALDLMALAVVPLVVYLLGLAVFPFGSPSGAP
jgi:sodium-dependent dicarboxylate transporter 2/3/5